MVYGQYSYEFLSTFKRYYIRSPFQYCFRDDFISHLLYVINRKDNVPAYTSLKDIYFENTHYFVGYKELMKKKGAPCCFNAFVFDQFEFEIKAIGYKETVAGSKATALFYFMNDSFFMGEYIFKKPVTDIKSSLAEHFLERKGIEADNFYIENSSKKIIHYQDTGFSVDIKYLCLEDQHIISNLQGYFQLITGKNP